MKQKYYVELNRQEWRLILPRHGGVSGADFDGVSADRGGAAAIQLFGL